MKNLYEKMEIEIIVFESVEIIAASSENNEGETIGGDDI